MIHSKKISIAFLIFSMTTTNQAMEIYEAPEQKAHTSSLIEEQSKTASKKQQKRIATEYLYEKTPTSSAQEATIKDIEKSTSTTSTPENSLKPIALKAARANEIDLNPESKTSTKPIETQPNYAEFDLATIEKKAVASEKTTPSEEHQSIADEIIKEEFDEKVKELFIESLHLPETTHRSLAAIITSGLQNLLFHLLGLPTEDQQEKPVELFTQELQYLSDQIQKYNNVDIYTDIDQMLSFIQNMNNFLKSSQRVPLSVTNIETIDTAYATALTASDVFKNENIILDLKFVPDTVLQMFSQPINDSKKLIKMKDTQSIIHAMYDQGGSIDIIIKSWQSFMTSTYISEKNNRCYAAFMTFLLIFQDSIIATIGVLNETNEKYKVTQQLSMQNINSPI